MRRRPLAAFTLVEVLVATALLISLLVVLVSMTGQASATWRLTTSKTEQFREARVAFETVTRRLSQATLNTYWDYREKDGLPAGYARQSELRFLCGDMQGLAGTSTPPRPTHGLFCQAPLGDSAPPAGPDHRPLPNLLNTWGCFVEFGDDLDTRPAFLAHASDLPPRRRFRLMEMLMPAEALTIYNPIATTDPAWRGWYAEALTGATRPVRVLAENVVGLLLVPKLAPAEEAKRRLAGQPLLAPDFEYDSTKVQADAEINSKNQLPPIVQVTLVVLDEPSAARLAALAGTAAPDLEIDGLFRQAARLEDNPATATPGDGDLVTWQSRLAARHLAFRVFTANVSLRAAKWSRAQTD